LKLADGGPVYLFGTTMQGCDHVLLRNVENTEKQTGIEKRNRRTGIGKAVAKDRVRLRKSVKPTKKTYEKIAR